MRRPPTWCGLPRESKHGSLGFAWLGSAFGLRLSLSLSLSLARVWPGRESKRSGDDDATRLGKAQATPTPPRRRRLRKRICASHTSARNHFAPPLRASGSPSVASQPQPQPQPLPLLTKQQHAPICFADKQQQQQDKAKRLKARQQLAAKLGAARGLRRFGVKSSKFECRTRVERFELCELRTCAQFGGQKAHAAPSFARHLHSPRPTGRTFAPRASWPAGQPANWPKPNKWPRNSRAARACHL